MKASAFCPCFVSIGTWLAAQVPPSGTVVAWMLPSDQRSSPWLRVAQFLLASVVSHGCKPLMHQSVVAIKRWGNP